MTLRGFLILGALWIGAAMLAYYAGSVRIVASATISRQRLLIAGKPTTSRSKTTRCNIAKTIRSKKDDGSSAEPSRIRFLSWTTNAFRCWQHGFPQQSPASHTWYTHRRHQILLLHANNLVFGAIDIELT